MVLKPVGIHTMLNINQIKKPVGYHPCDAIGDLPSPGGQMCIDSLYMHAQIQRR